MGKELLKKQAVKIISLKCFLTMILPLNTYAQNIEPVELAQTKNICIIDGHSHIGLTNNDGHVSINGISFLRKFKINTIFYSFPVKKIKDSNLYDQIEDELRQLEKLSAVRETKHSFCPGYRIENINFYFSVEYFHGLNGFDDNTFLKLSDRGVKYLTLIDSKNFKIFEENQLTDSGKILIEKLNQANITIDIAHLNEYQINKVLNYSKKPIIASHTNAKTVADLKYNLSDSTLKNIVAKNGLIMVSFNKNGLFASAEEMTNGISKFCDHILHLNQLIGVKNIAIGTDLQAMGKYIPPDLNENEAVNEIVFELLNRGLTLNEIQQIMKHNIERFFDI